MTASNLNITEIRVPDLSARMPNPIRLAPDAQTCGALITSLGISGLRKVVMEGKITSEGQRDWKLEANLGATVVQPCVVSLEPVTTRIEHSIIRRYLADGVPIPEDDEAEMSGDDTLEPLGNTIDLLALLEEALAIALPDYPRTENAEYIQKVAAPNGVAPLSDDDVRPFAALAALKGKLQNDD